MGDLQEALRSILEESKQQQKAEEAAEKRLSTKEAAKYLGCTTGFLQKLHQRGLPYEKGRPNYYRLADLQAYRATLRLHLNQ